MSFDADLAQRITTSSDRDIAPYFAGREVEIAAFRAAVDEAKGGRKATVFRVFHGAPGAGKSSLLHHLTHHHSKGALVVPIRTTDLASHETLSLRIDHALVQDAADRGKALQPIVKIGLSALGEAAKPTNAVGLAAGLLREIVQDRLAQHVERDGAVVLMLDEAQLLDERHKDVLNDLHIAGVGVPSTLVLSGLSRTVTRLAELGISRLSRHAVTDIGAMSAEECAESTRLMMDDLGVSPSQRRDEWCEQAGALSFGWPQHLHGSQAAMCEELMRVGGDIDRASLKKVEDRSDDFRAQYYRARLDSSPVLSYDPEVTYKLIVAVNEGKPAAGRRLVAVCDAMLKDEGVDSLTGREFADAMIDKGVVCPRRNGDFEIPIPSMVKWAEEAIQEHERRTTQRAH